MTSTRFERLLPIAGVLAGALFATMGVLQMGMPSITDDDRQAMFRWLDEHSGQAQLSGAAAGYFCVTMLLFAVALRRALRSGEDGESTYSSVAFAGAVLVATAVALQGWVVLAAQEAAGHGNPAVVASLGFLSDFGWIPWVAGSAVMLLGAGLGGLRTAMLPRWLSVVTVVLAVLCLLGPTGVAVYFATPLWLVVTGVVLARPQPARPALPAQASSSSTDQVFTTRSGATPQSSARSHP
jgi:hypothetical protein